MKPTNAQSLAELSGISESLISAVAESMGGWNEFTESAPDVINHGASGGFGQFIYHRDTVSFFEKNRRPIADALKSTAEDIGKGILETVRSFYTFRNNRPELDLIGEVLFSPLTAEEIFEDSDKVEIANVLAWFALEEVSRVYCDAMENETA